MTSTQPAPALLSAAEGALRLCDWGVIRASGADAAAFLHGQLTQDIEHLAEGQARLAGYCSAKGRLLATFVVLKLRPDELLLACSADVLPAMLKRLSMFVLRAKCKLDDASAEWPLWGLAGEAARAALPVDAAPADWALQRHGEAAVVRLPAGRLGDESVPRWLWAGGDLPASSQLATLSPAVWLGLEAASGVARVVAATAELFVPQMVNFELVGGVSFQKGCYPGQEIVARSQYRGTVKRRAQLVLAAAPLQPGQEVFQATEPEQPTGHVVLAGELPGLGPVALVELKLSALDSPALHAGAADGPALRLAALPYNLPADAV
jgi:tRNA-modifying protein YgfZ